MQTQYPAHSRVFKTAWFSKAARKARITDQALCKAMKEVELGQADDLGGGVYKKRLNNNMHRSIVLSKASTFWVYEYLFAKSDRANIEDDELNAFRELAKGYAGLTVQQVNQLITDKQLKEICRG
jgi:hypothetical protein